MTRIGIFYGSTTGSTEEAAKKIFDRLGDHEKEIINVDSASKEDLERFDILILGSSTWGVGELQDDWENFLKDLENADLNNKKVALFGCGDSMGYPDSFCDALGIIYNTVKEKNAEIIGMVKPEDYSFDVSAAVVDNNFIGLPIDEDNESDKTDNRIEKWVENIKTHL